MIDGIKKILITLKTFKNKFSITAFIKCVIYVLKVGFLFLKRNKYIYIKDNVIFKIIFL